MNAKPGRNDPCPCGSGKKFKKCCGAPTIDYDPPTLDPGKIEGTNDGRIASDAPLLQNVPNIFIATPWNHRVISTGFCSSMINLALTLPFPAHFSAFSARNTQDARNAICVSALQEHYSHILMIDADQYVDNDTFGRLWKILEEYGHDNTIASAWATIRGGPFKGNTSILVEAEGGLAAVDSATLPKETFRAYSVGTPGMLFSTRVLEKIQPPWFAELYIIDRELAAIEGSSGTGEEDEDPDEVKVYWPLERMMSHDFVFGIRMTEAGVNIMIDPECKLPHEMVETI